MAAPLYTTASGLLWHAGKILILTIGLPARGKTHISRSLERYLRWMGVKIQVVSLGDYRRKSLGGAKKLPPDYFTPGTPLSVIQQEQGTDELMIRREESRNDNAAQDCFGRMRESNQRLFSLRRSGRNIRCEQRDSRSSP